MSGYYYADLTATLVRGSIPELSAMNVLVISYYDTIIHERISGVKPFWALFTSTKILHGGVECAHSTY
jgi:hypothetical protein